MISTVIGSMMPSTLTATTLGAATADDAAASRVKIAIWEARFVQLDSTACV
jgi:hypothetical protein